MNQAREALLRKVRAMLAKASSTDNEDEAMAFMEKAQAWLVEHNISRAELEAEDHDYVMDNAPTPCLTPWEQRVNNALARLYMCRYFIVTIRGEPVSAFVGEEHNVRVAKAMSEYVVEFLARRAQEGQSERSEEDTLLYEISFLHQASVTLADRIKQRILASLRGKASGSSGTTLPALMDTYTQTQAKLDDFLKEQLGIGARTELPSLERHDLKGLEDGHAAGNAVGLETQIGVTERKALK